VVSVSLVSSRVFRPDRTGPTEQEATGGVGERLEDAVIVGHAHIIGDRMVTFQRDTSGTVGPLVHSSLRGAVCFTSQRSMNNPG
jgi:hypothetical protein